MYGKGLALTLACTSPLFLQPAVHFARFSAAGRILVVHFALFLAAPRIRALHFAGILAAPLIRAVHSGAFLAGRRTRAVHFPRFLAGSRALRTFSCRSAISCKDLGEVHVERPAGRPFRRALPPFPCRHPCTSPVSLHEFAPLQGFGGSARHGAGIEGKCTSARPPHAGPLAHSPQISASRRKVRTHIGSPAQPAFGPPRAYSAPQQRKRRRRPERLPGSTPWGSRLRSAHSGNSPGSMHGGKLKLARPR